MRSGTTTATTSAPRSRARGGSVAAKIAIPPTESSFTRYFPQIPADTEVLYHVMVGPGVLTFVKEMGEHFGSKRPRIFGFIDSLEGVDIASPGLSFLEGTYLWEAMPRYAGGLDTAANRLYREKVGINADGASVDDPKDVSTNSHMFGCWETPRSSKVSSRAGTAAAPRATSRRSSRRWRAFGASTRGSATRRATRSSTARCTSATGASSSPRSGAAGSK